MSILDTLVTDRVPGASYGFPDMNRVGEAMEYVAARLRACGFHISCGTSMARRRCPPPRPRSRWWEAPSPI